MVMLFAVLAVALGAFALGFFFGTMYGVGQEFERNLENMLRAERLRHLREG